MAHKHPVYDTDKHFSINPITRVLINESPSKVSLIQYDHNSERFTFEIPRMIEGHDMSACNVVQIHYLNSSPHKQNAGIYEVDDMQISPSNEEVVVLSWLISQNATQLVGTLSFLIRFACISEDGKVEYAWNTYPYSNISISAGIYNSNVVAEEYADILEQWRQTFMEVDQLPKVDTSKNNMFLQVVEGAWTAVNAVPQVNAIVASYINTMLIPVTQEEYDALVAAGTIDESKYYMIVGDSE